MAAPAITEYLAEQDVERFCNIVRKYSHDVISTASNLAIAAEVAAKLVTRKGDVMLVDPALGGQVTPSLNALLRYAVNFPRPIRRFVWGDNPDDKDASAAYAAQHYMPFDAPVWDWFVGEYIAYVQPYVQSMETLVQEIEDWEGSGALAGWEHPDEYAHDHQQGLEPAGCRFRRRVRDPAHRQGDGLGSGANSRPGPGAKPGPLSRPSPGPGAGAGSSSGPGVL
jgi:hypothetical protein